MWKQSITEFFDKLVDELKNETKYFDYETIPLDKDQIPFIISSLWQSFRAESNTYEEFISDLSEYFDYQIHIIRPTNDYCGICDIQVYLYNNELSFLNEINNRPDHSYLIQIFNDERMWGYCECGSGDQDYREDKDCCGHGCDWDAPAFSFHKVEDIKNHVWIGDEHDFWDFEDDFYKSETELNEEKIKNEKSEIKRLQDLINESQERLNQLYEK